MENIDDVRRWLTQMPPPERYRVARLLADTATARALAATADEVVYDLTREHTQAEVADMLKLSAKQVKRSVELHRAALAGKPRRGRGSPAA